MNWALGCAFNINDILENFPYKKLKFNCNLCESIVGDKHRDILVKRIFKESIKLIINDIIDNNITFWLPLTGNKKCCIKMKRVEGNEFKNLRKGGKWKNVDFVKSMFSGYEIRFFMYGKRTPRTKTVYLNKELTNRITENTNNGMQYGDGKVDKCAKDYYNDIQQLFPEIDKKDIKQILNFSWKSLYLHNSYGGDTLILDKDIWFYIGHLKKDSLDHFYYYIRKLSTKLRVLYKRRKIKWDGYYYFALNQTQYDNTFGSKQKRGRPKKNFIFNNVLLYQILDECKLQESSKRYICRIPYISQLNFKYFIPQLKTDKAELIITRDPLKFKDILVYENDYEFL